MNKNKIAFQATVGVIILALMLAALPVSPVFAADTVPTNPGNGANGSLAGSINWTNPGYITTPGAPYATVPLTDLINPSNYLQGTQYNFAIPLGSTIDGITVVIRRMRSSEEYFFDTQVSDNVVSLIKAGVLVGSNKASPTNWPTSFGTATYGGPTDRWGTTWTAAEINAPNFGVALSAKRSFLLQERTATVDTLQITVTYTLPETTTVVNCGSGTVVVTSGSSITCTATVSGLGGNTPGGTVSWATNGDGSFGTAPECAPSGGSLICSNSYTPNAVGSGSHLITATYGGDTNFTGSNGNQTVTVNRATPSLYVTNSPVTYNGSPQVADVVGSVPGTVSNVLYDGSVNVPTNAGTYAITADFVPDSANYTSLTNAPAGNFVIGQVTPTLSVTNSPVTYNGSAQAAVVVGSVPGTDSNVLYDGSATVPINEGTYAVTADFVPDSANYTSLTNAPAGNFIIGQVTPTLSVSNSPVTYNGSPQAAVVVGSAPGTVSNVLYDGSATVPINEGTYAVTANFVPTDTANYTSLTNAAAGNFVIGQVTSTLSVTNSPVTYNSSPQAVVVVGSVPGTVSNVLYDGSATVPTNAGTYVITANFVPTDTANYTSLTNAPAGNFVIGQVTSTLSVSNSPVTYNGSPQAAVVVGSVPGTVSNVLYNGSATVPTNAGTYAITANFVPDSANYTSLTNAQAGNFIINASHEALTLAVTPTPTTFSNVGNIISYSYLLTNSGDVPLAGPFSVSDDKSTVTCSVTASLAPAASITCTASYTIQSVDIASGFVTNIATASASYGGNPVLSNTATATVRTLKLFLPLVIR